MPDGMSDWAGDPGTPEWKMERHDRFEKFIRSLVNEDAEQAVEKAYHDPELRMQWRQDHWQQLVELAALSREARGVLDG